MEAVDAGALEFRDEHGAIRTLSALRWGNACEKTFQYIPFGCEVHAERRFGDLALPNNISVGWWSTRRATPPSSAPSFSRWKPSLPAGLADGAPGPQPGLSRARYDQPVQRPTAA